MSQDRVEQLTLSWRANAQAWTQAVRGRQIESRRLVTDTAILQSTLARTPKRVLDVGCGEGWLCRALAEQGIEAVGVDASEPLIEAARGAGGGAYHVLSYAQLGSAQERLGRFDAIVCNFALMEEDLHPLLVALRSLLRPAGVLLIQTVHACGAGGDGPYRDGWRTETFAGFGAGFTEPMPWFYRTPESWATSLRSAGWRIEELAEPVHPQTGLSASLLIVASHAAAREEE